MLNSDTAKYRCRDLYYCPISTIMRQACCVHVRSSPFAQFQTAVVQSDLNLGVNLPTAAANADPLPVSSGNRQLICSVKPTFGQPTSTQRAGASGTNGFYLFITSSFFLHSPLQRAFYSIYHVGQWMMFWLALSIILEPDVTRKARDNERRKELSGARMAS